MTMDLDIAFAQIIGSVPGIPPQDWTPDWISFDQQYSQNEDLLANTTKDYMHRILPMILAIETNPIPSNILTLLLKNFFPLSFRSNIYFLILETAAKNSKTYQECYQTLIHHYLQYNIMTECELKSSLCKCLHTCAECNSSQTAKAIIEFYPEALKYKNVMGFLPIHSVFSYQNQNDSGRRSNIFNLFIEQGIKYDIGGKDGCGGIFLQKFQQNVSVNPIHTISGTSPLELVLYYLRQSCKKEVKDDSKDEWTCLTICYDTIKSSATKTNFQLINYIINLQSVGMESLIPEIMRKYNIDLNAADENGMTALIIAIKEKKLNYIQTLLSIQNNANKKIERCVVNGKQYSNCLPLHIALHEGLKWNQGLKDIFEIYRDAVTMFDPVTGLYPYMVAANKDDFDVTYDLLRSDPGVIENCVVNKNYHDLEAGKFKSMLRVHYHHFIIGIVLSIVLYVMNIK